MLFSELLTLGIREPTERIECTSKLSLESITGLYYLLLNLVTLLTSHSGSEGIVCEITANADTSRFNHGSIFRRERWALKLVEIHIRDMAIALFVTMILLNNFVEQRCKGGIGVVAASIDSDARIYILHTREDCTSKRESTSIFLIFQ